MSIRPSLPGKSGRSLEKSGVTLGSLGASLGGSLGPSVTGTRQTNTKAIFGIVISTPLEVLRLVQAKRPPCRVSLVARSRFHPWLSEPIFEPSLPELRAVIGNECSLLYLDAVVASVRVHDNLARILVRGQAFPDDVIEMGPFRPCNFNRATDGLAQRHDAYRARHIIGCHRLEKHMWQAYRVALRRKIGDALDEFEELRRAHNGIGDCRSLDQILLSHFCAEVAAFKHALGSHDRQRDMMFQARGRFLGKEIPRSRREETHHRRVFPRRS